MRERSATLPGLARPRWQASTEQLPNHESSMLREVYHSAKRRAGREGGDQLLSVRGVASSGGGCRDHESIVTTGRPVSHFILLSLSLSLFRFSRPNSSIRSEAAHTGSKAMFNARRPKVKVTNRTACGLFFLKFLFVLPAFPPFNRCKPRCHKKEAATPHVEEGTGGEVETALRA